MTPTAPKRILVGVDAHGHAEKALNVAIGLAVRFDAELQLVHGVRAFDGFARAAPDAVEVARHAILLGMEASLSGAQLPAEFCDQHLTIEVVKHPAELILRQARESGTDLIVLGRHQKHGLLHFDDNVRAVLSQAQCPVWVQAGPMRETRRILVPVDLSEDSLSALRSAVNWGLIHSARLLVLHCFTSPEPFTDEGWATPGPTYIVEDLRKSAASEFSVAMDSFEWSGVEHELVFVEDEPVPRILRLQDSVDLVMMGTHGHTGFSGALLGHVADLVIRHGHVPVVALRHPEREWLV
jgi:nucleotide-binding universal stress UspA family protein